MQMNPPPSPILDGFTFNSRIICYQSYFHNALSGLEPIRRANAMRLRMHGVPEAQFSPISPYESVEDQIRVLPGSYLWGWSFFTAQAQPPNSTVPINSIRIVDSCTELPIVDRPVLCTMFSNVTVTGQTQLNLGQNTGVILLPRPYLIASPGGLNVEVTNASAFPATCQLLLMIAEPSINQNELAQAIKGMH
jgi:hypothetical protein